MNEVQDVRAIDTDQTGTQAEGAGQPEDRSERYCVIGAGSSGLAAGKNLREYGFEVDILEREAEVGGNWNFGQGTARVYESTHTISSKPFTQFPDYPMPASYPDYPHHSQILSYLKAYADHFELRDVIEFETSVEHVEPVDGGALWQVVVEGPDGEVSSRLYRGVVVANGHNWYPKEPAYDGEFDGEIMHSASYRSADVLDGKRVVVVGAGNTGCDVAVEAGRRAARAFHSTRRAYWYAPKYTFGRPSDQVFDLMLSLRLPERVVQYLIAWTQRLVVGDLERIGLEEPDHLPLETHPIVNSLLPYYVGHGAIEPKPDIERLAGDRVVFEDGTSEEVDLIVNCTGYLIRFPFMDHELLDWHQGRPRLARHVFSGRYPNLGVVGLIQPDSGQFKLVHWQSVAFAKLQRLRETDRGKLDGYMRRFRQEIDNDVEEPVVYKETTRHFVEVQHFHYLEGLSELITGLEEDLEEQNAGDEHRALDGMESGHRASVAAESVMRPWEWALPSPDVELEVRRADPDNGSEEGERPPILFVHGLGGAAWMFEKHWLGATAARGWPARAMSLRGHGESGGRRRRYRWTMRDYVDDVLETVRALESRAVLVGHGFGAWIIERVARRYPARAAVMVAPTPVNGAGFGVVRDMIRMVNGLVRRGELGIDHERDRLLSDRLPDDLARMYASRLTQPTWINRLETWVPRQLGDSKASVRVIGSTDDSRVSPEQVRHTAEALGAPCEIVDGGGHLMMLDGAWKRALEAVLTRVEDVTG